MEYTDAIRAASSNPQALEALYQEAQKAGSGAEFQAGIEALHGEDPSNLLLAAWFYRLQSQPQPARRPVGGPNWKLAVPLGAITGLILWAISDERLTFLGDVPLIVLLWAPVAALLALAFLAFTARKDARRSLLAAGLVTLGSAAVFLLAPGQSRSLHSHYLLLMAIHLPLLCWIGLGVSRLGRGTTTQDRFAFLMKSLEVMITAGLYLIAGVAFGGITIGLFAAVGVELPLVIQRLIAAGGFGLLPVMALATTYDPHLPPSAQDFSQGLSRFIATMMRLLLPLTLVVLVIYIAVIPFNFLQPFRNRDVLIVYNLMLFAIMGLLIGVTPVNENELAPRLLANLRRGILAVAALTELVSLYALSATAYRTAQAGITINRLTILGWNSINIAILALILLRVAGRNPEGWVERIKATFSLGMILYVVWDIFLIVAIPLLFR